MSKAKQQSRFRDRIKELRRVRAGDLRPNPANWRTHPPEQRSVIEAILAEIGYADAVLARELPDGGLEIVDGHLRADLDPEQQVPVLVLDVTEAEASKLLAVLDPVAMMAQPDEAAQRKLLSEVEADEAELRHLIDEMLAALPAEGEEAESRGGGQVQARPEWPARNAAEAARALRLRPGVGEEHARVDAAGGGARSALRDAADGEGGCGACDSGVQTAMASGEERWRHGGSWCLAGAACTTWSGC